MSKKRVLTGVTTTGIPHLGNYVGAIRPAVRAAQNPDTESFLFLADYHGIIKCHEPEMIHQSTQAVAATWLACGLDPERTTFYRQSDIPVSDGIELDSDLHYRQRSDEPRPRLQSRRAGKR